MKKFDFETLNNLIDQSIQLKDGENKIVELKVEKVSLPKASDPGYEAFSVDLSSEKDVHCPSGNYLFSHDAFGETQLFMSPYAADKYQIVIARKK
ncbi:DUF6916 family protein [Cellvibrio japonicus]|uniref:DUF6916 domain-containing protein n=1 Tax=Cellvibrio japonicus (strain Ueda107) TaxID=498211 RepID=B3PJI9_CELJU|nr:hypothetical protein [Cellvibrio japonicus]ACE85135.1 hypothetical protein CJA_0595 [Cellvibrio japonicus Ueda107]QEI11275.1 hypothetical protein FY117_02865 [Cellvibrio japonicus]QEI14849.1 hypothetical protein FY116_02865 [Cellvibrio japonicus]QEI18429.1 hypothetical protein FY115_02865 [Cellvibrio japonicus]